MERQASSDDLLALASSAHACRGAWAEFGGRQAQHQASRLEQACRDGDRDQAFALVAEVRRASAVTAERLAAELAARSAQRRGV